MKRFSLLLIASVWTGPIANAQQDDIRARVVEGRVLISELNDSTQQTSETRAFGGRLDDFLVSDDPGYNSFGGDLPPGAAVAWDFIPVRANGTASTLMHWDGQSSEPDFSPTPFVLTHYGQNFDSINAGGTDQIVVGPTLFFADGEGAVSPGSVHKHRDYFLHDGNFNASPTPDEGFYLISMRLRVDGFIRSDPLFVVLGTDDSSITTQNDVLLPWIEENADNLVLPGDHNFDGRVDAADYTVWRDGFGVTHTAADYDDWIAGYGAVAESLGGTAGLVVPEPATSIVTLFGLSLLAGCQRRSRAV